MDGTQQTSPRDGGQADAPLAALGSTLRRAGDRRAFLRSAGLGGAALALLGACNEGVTEPLPANLARNNGPQFSRPGAVVLNFKDDFGVLNYAYALEQLEAAFYIQVLQMPYSGITARERRILEDVRDHEIVHREFYEAALGSKRIPDLVPDFSMVNFDSRQSVLTTAQTFEDLGVAAYNGAAKLLESTTFLVVAGKIVSVEARHASVIRDLVDVLLNPPREGLFAPNAFDPAFTPEQVLAAADPFIKTKIVAVNL